MSDWERVGVAVDVIVVDAEKLAKYHDSPLYIYREALEEGQVLYEYPNP